MDGALQIAMDIALLLSNEFVFSIIAVACVLFAERRNDKRKKILFTVLITFIMVVALKEAFAIQRPCADTLSEAGCPDLFLSQYSFPSGHAAIAFLLMIAFLGKPPFPFFWVFALITAASRLLLGVHTFEDIAGSLVLAPIAYHIADLIWRRYYG